VDLTDKLEEMNIRKMELETGLKSINEVRQEMGLEVVTWGDKPLNYNQSGVEAPEPDTGNEELDNAFKLIRQAETDVYRNYDYMNGGLL
jgi:hypothetical protein